MNEIFERIYDATRSIPSGRVLSYGGVAIRAGLSPSSARVVGWALRALPVGRTDVPWQRVVNKQGILSIINPTVDAIEQKKLLELEGVIFEQREDYFQVRPEFFLE